MFDNSLNEGPHTVKCYTGIKLIKLRMSDNEVVMICGH